LRDVTTHISGTVCRPYKLGLDNQVPAYSLDMINPHTKIEVYVHPTH